SHDPANTVLYTLSLHDALPICTETAVRKTCPTSSVPSTSCTATTAARVGPRLRTRRTSFPTSLTPRTCWARPPPPKRARTRNMRSEEHTSELQSLAYLVCRLLL